MNKAYVKFKLYQLGHDQQWLSQETEIDYAYLSRILNGKTNPTLTTIKKIGNAIGADYNELLKEKVK